MKTVPWLIALFLVSLIVGLLRFTVPGHGLSWPGSYEALAHIWCGVLLTIVLTPSYGFDRRSTAGWCLGFISLLELVMFLGRK